MHINNLTIFGTLELLKTSLLNKNSFHKIFLLASILVLSEYSDMLLGASQLIGIQLLLPFFILDGGDGGDGGDSGDCGNEAQSDGSTPFLCTWDGDKFIYDNDFLLGEPTTFRENFTIGEKAYKRRELGPDLYHIRSPFLFKDRMIAFQIKEIEPEETFIDTLSLTRVLYPQNGELVVDSRHNTFYVFNKKELNENKDSTKQKILINGITAPSELGDLSRIVNEKKKDGGYKLEVNDTIEIQGNVGKKKSPVFLIVGSRYRDWTPSRITQVDEVESNYITASSILTQKGLSIQGFARTSLVIVLATALWATGVASKLGRTIQKNILSFSNVSEDSLRKLSQDNFKVPHAYADTPHSCSSLFESYFDWEENVFKTTEIIHPRHYNYSIDAVTLPERAINENGDVRVRIVASKRHYVSVASIFKPKQVLDFKQEKLSVRKIYHNRLEKDFSNTIEKQFSGQYLHTVPGDVVDVEFTPSPLKANNDEQESYLLGSTGFYTPLSENVREEVGDWVETLDPEARLILSDMRPLEDYYV